jgi:Putative heavy-metal-binding
MGFFSGHGADAEGSDQKDAKDWTEGGIPLASERRLQALGSEGSLFTSGLSVNEFALLDKMRLRPLAQVMGASVLRVGWQYLPALPPGVWISSGSWQAPYTGRSQSFPGPLAGSSRSWQSPYPEPSLAQVRSYKWYETVVCELDTITTAWTQARRQALDRLSEEAIQVGGDAVVGVHLKQGEHDWAGGTIDYVVYGTAVRFPDSTGSSRPILTDLSVQDYWRLHAAGHEPVGLVGATSVIFASPSRSIRLQRLRTTRDNQELEELSRGFQVGRETVRERLRGQVGDCRGSGAVGVTLSHAVHRETLSVESSLTSSASRGWHLGRLGLPYRVSGRGDVDRTGWVITMHGAGTAIRSRPDVPQYPAEPVMRLGPT